MMPTAIKPAMILNLGKLVLLICGLAGTTNVASGLGEPQTVTTTPTPGSLTLHDANSVATIIVGTNDWPGVTRAATDLATDLNRVTGLTPRVAAAPNVRANNVVIIGTLGKSELIDQLIKTKQIEVSEIRGKWESFFHQVIPHPFPGVDSALVICGSDKRGTIYGIYNLSEQIGVSPWHYWADVPPKQHDRLFVSAPKSVHGPPAVKYRGIFLNDEYPALTRWVQEQYGSAPGYRQTANYGRGFYTNLFELMLRIRANYLWPAMWNNAFNEDDPENARLADEYGIVMGTSHQEPMLRAQKEWDRSLGKQYRNWDYTKPAHRPILQQFWREGIRRNKNFESIITMGLRAENDSGEDVGKELTEQIVKVQRDILAEELNSDLTQIPQMWCLYKEVMGYYQQGLRPPDDITLLWAEDNWGNVRRLPTPDERHRTGGAGIYYHFDYHGGPRSYQWINTSPIPKIWDQLTLAKQYGADRIWIVNVGHFKGYELPMEFFMHLAWNPSRWSHENLTEYTRLWAEREFGPAQASEIAELVIGYTQFNGRRKPELLDAHTYSLVNYQEFETVVADYDALAARAQEVYDQLPPENRDAFYGLVQFPIKACAQLHALYLAAARNALYAKQGRASANDFAAQTHALFAAQTNLMDHFNHRFAGGKWNHFMDQTHIGYTSWNDPPHNTMDAIHLTTLEIPEAPAMGIAIAGSTSAWPEAQAAAVLPQFDALNQPRQFIDVFNQGQKPFAFSAKPSAPWIVLSQTAGEVQKETRVWVSVDWNLAPTGTAHGAVVFSGTGRDVSVAVAAFNPPNLTRNSRQSFVEADGVVSIEAEHFTAKHDVGENRWIKLPHYGHTLSAMRATAPVDAESTPQKDAPWLEYQMHLFTTGKVEVEAIVGATLNFIPGRSLRYAVSFDAEPPQVITIVPANFDVRNGNRDWEESVKNNCRRLKSTHTITQPGDHTLKIWMVDPAVMLQKIVINTGGVRPSYLGPPESFRLDNPARGATR